MACTYEQINMLHSYVCGSVLPTLSELVIHNHLYQMYRVFIKYCVFSLKVVIFLNSASSAVELALDLPSGGQSVKPSVHTLTLRENQQRPESGIYFKILEKTIFNEHPVGWFNNSSSARRQVHRSDNHLWR